MTHDNAPPPAPPGVDPAVPNVARMHDYILNGSAHYPADVERAERVLAEFPASRALIEAGREFLAYGVGVAQAAGIGQFLDVGAGLPTTGNTHQLAPGARVVYVDLDPAVVAHALALLAAEGAAGVAVLELDAADVAGILAAATDPARGAARLDLAEPVCVVMTCVLHFVGRDPGEIAADYLAALAPGSMLIATHGTGDPEALAQARRLYTDANFHGYARSAAELEAAFSVWDLSPSGLARVEHFTRGGELVDDERAAAGIPTGVLTAGFGTQRNA